MSDRVLHVAPAPPVSKQRALPRAVIALEIMQRLGLATGDLIAVNHVDHPDKIVLGIAWPSTDSSKDVIQLSVAARLSAELQIGDSVRLERIALPQVEANTVRLRPTSPLPTNATNYIKQKLVDVKYIRDGQTIDLHVLGHVRRFVLSCSAILSPAAGANPVYVVTQTTRVILDTASPAVTEPAVTTPSRNDTISYDAIGGLAEQVHIVRDMVETSLKNPDLFRQYGLRPPRGVLLFGPPGTGKTLIARVVAQEVGAHVIVVNGPEVLSKFYGETEKRIRDIFAEAAERAPTIIFIDEIDALCPKRDQAPSELEKRVVATLLTLMDGASEQQRPDRVVVLAATNRPNALDEALRRPGRFDREVEIGIPNSDARLSILQAVMRNIPHQISPAELKSLADRSHGYVGADLAAVCREAGLKCIKRCAREKDSVDLRVNFADMTEAMGGIRPSAMREILLEVPKVHWTDIGGQEDIKQRLKESVEWPLQHPEAFERLGIRPPKGILLYGPPGCSKTLMAKALATEAGSNFIAVKGPELFSKWVGESEKAVREVFRKARAASPSIVFFDEIDALTVKRGGDGGTSVSDRVLSQLLNEMDGIEALVNVTVVAATNRPDIIDEALLRPGRIDRILYVGPPDYDARRDIFRIQLQKMACDNDVDLDELAEKSAGCSGAEAVALCQEAALLAMEESVEIDSVKRRHFIEALNTFKRRITPEMIQFYDDFRSQSKLQSI
ncbi:P-loop containing nucleoside triphosphate hydrolase protein [Syncephalastrum racemosum]|uniref:P-loop containing nucleoside triphosphate hydrolase protein n=1 Tax=Syncephalastrum racemosum TaxID=13706 RepID=A0A1X2HDH5_SYNRA|nr:P-loop containing nucleoside triphosphate hydrolase protein [Syncephalastrum racemosum]